MRKRLFIVVNPTQYLHSIEYAFKLRLRKEENFMLLMTPFINGVKEIDQLGTSNFWSEVKFHDLSKYANHKTDSSFWRDSWSFIKNSFEEIEPEELVVGNLTDGFIYPLVLLKKKKLEKIVALDDGHPTLNVASHRKNNSFAKEFNFKSPKTLLKYLLYTKVFLPALLPPKSVCFFSLYDIEFGAKDKLLVNSFDWIKSKINDQKKGDQVYFVGSNLVDRRLISESDYLKSMRFVIEDLKGQDLKLTYVYHRGESIKMRKKISDLCETVEFDKPLELVFLGEPRPKMFVGNFSSALFSLSRIYSSVKVKSYLFPGKAIKGSEHEPRKYLLDVQEALKQDSFIETAVIQVNEK